LIVAVGGRLLFYVLALVFVCGIWKEEQFAPPEKAQTTVVVIVILGFNPFEINSFLDPVSLPVLRWGLSKMIVEGPKVRTSGSCSHFLRN